MQLATLLQHVRTLAPETLAEKWDQVGLHLGDPSQDVQRALLCIDFTPRVLMEAVKLGSQLVIAYHPPIFSPLTRLTEEDWKQRLVVEAVRRHLAVYSPHTALDAVPGGLNDWWCDGLGKGVRMAIIPHVQASAPGGLHKIVTFVPHEAVERVRASMAAAGAGCIGDYSACSFVTQGMGTFRGSPETNPAVGKPGRFEQVPEVRLEMVCPAEWSTAVQQALMLAHPYEEPAFDVYPLLPPLRRTVPVVTEASSGSPSDGKGVGAIPKATTLRGIPGATAAVGAGRIVQFDQGITLPTLLQRLRTRLGSSKLQVFHADRNARMKVQRVAVCVGAGGALLAPAISASDRKLEVFFTGEMRHHDVLDAVHRGVTVILAGHTQTERPFLPVYRERLSRITGNKVAWRVSQFDGLTW